ncbi:hypothetical protein KR018_005497 [Drosophila ironensis]|nr:hypothetical protein KR018_005497 [Drosophila ironensis]
MNTRRRSVAPSPNIYATNVKICRLVAQHSCLYDRSDVTYMRKINVRNAWKLVSKEMRNSVKSCKERWRNIRTSYARSIKVHPIGNTYYLNNELQFLQPHITPGVPVPLRGRRARTKDTGEQEDQEQDQEDSSDRDLSVADDLLEVKQSPSSPDTEHAPSPGSSAQEENTETESETESREESGKRSWPTQSRKRLRLSKESFDDVQVRVPHVLGTYRSSADASASFIDFDEAFLQGIRPEIKEMNFHQKLYFKRRVYELLGEIFSPEDVPTSVQQPSAQQHRHLPENTNGALSTPSPLQHMGLTLQLPKLVPKPS